MPGQIIELAQNGRSLHLERGFLAVREGGETIGRVPIDDIDAVLATAHGIMWSNKALAALSARGVPVVIMADDFTPASALLPLRGHHDQGRRMRAQADASKPLRKRAWADLVRAKIDAQAATLDAIGQPSGRLQRLRGEVRSGDTTNREALAAQAYWPLMMGADFRRARAGSDANGMLNYGYAVLRAAAARAVVAAGLHPALSVHHVSDGDAFALADDIMEPFRPAVDLVVRDLKSDEVTMDDREAKSTLTGILQADYRTEAGRTPLSHCLVRTAQSLAALYLGATEALELPRSALPLPPELDL